MTRPRPPRSLSRTSQTSRSSSRSSRVTSPAPPMQVYTKGRRGAVTTRSYARSRSQTREPRETIGSSRHDSDSGSSSSLQQRLTTKQPPQQQQQPNHPRQRLQGVTSSLSPRQRSSSQRPIRSASLLQKSVHSSNHKQSSYEESIRSTPSLGDKSKHSSSAASVTTTEERGPQKLLTSLPHDDLKLQIRLTRKVVEDLTRAQGSDRRLAAITTACETFDHADESLHNVELYHGAATALTRWLGLTFHNDDEVRMICSALEMVFRGSIKSVQLAFEKMGTTTAAPNLPLHLLRVMNRCENGSMMHSEINVLNIFKILLYLSRCPGIRSGLCHVPGMLPALSKSHSHYSADCRMARIRILSNLANCPENKVLMYESSRCRDVILRTAHLDDVASIRHHAAVALAELASDPLNQPDMVANETMLGTLIKMMLVEEASATRESVISAIQNLAFGKENRLKLITFKSGILVEALKKSLVRKEKDPKARRRAAGAITNLASNETSPILGAHPGLLDTLAIVATKDSSLDVQKRSMLALTKLAIGISNEMDCHVSLLDALVMASLSTAENNIAAVIRVKAREPENRQALARHPGILDTLSDICMSDMASVAERDSAVRAIMHLVNEETNRKVMCNKTILNALVGCASFKDEDLADARDSAIRAMERLATEFTNRAGMARHPGLLVVVSKAVEREAEWELDGRKSEHGFLAKPLLMSLLIAM